MHVESPEANKVSYDDMDFVQLSADPKAGLILEKQALDFLKSSDVDFSVRFTGELDEDGYLVFRNHKGRIKPSQCIAEGKEMDSVMKMTKDELMGRGTIRYQNSPTQDTPTTIDDDLPEIED